MCFPKWVILDAPNTGCGRPGRRPHRCGRCDESLTVLPHVQPRSPLNLHLALCVWVGGTGVPAHHSAFSASDGHQVLGFLSACLGGCNQTPPTGWLPNTSTPHCSGIWAPAWLGEGPLLGPRFLAGSLRGGRGEVCTRTSPVRSAPPFQPKHRLLLLP